MLRTTMVSAAITILVSAGLAQATVIEISLPGLLGDFPVSQSNASRTVTIELPQAPIAIHGASFRVSGTTTVGLADCGDEYGGLQSFPMAIEATMVADGPAIVWYAVDPNVGQSTGLFSWTTVFRPTSPGATWSFLMDGVTDITLSGPDPGTWCNVLVHPTSSVTEAVLLLDADFPVAVEPSTWGRIKSLYR